MSGANCHFLKLNFSNPLKKSPDRVICLECLFGKWALLHAWENQYKSILSLPRGVKKIVYLAKRILSPFWSGRPPFPWSGQKNKGEMKNDVQYAEYKTVD
jgi:hypothetical protein